jgi:hypothetical protein
MLRTYLEILQEEEGKDVFDMILVLQFLGLEDIPVLLLDFLPADNDLNHRGLNTTNFIQAIQKFSNILTFCSTDIAWGSNILFRL